MKLVIFWLLLACAKQNGNAVHGAEASAVEAAADPSGGDPAQNGQPETENRCYRECTQANMARAVAWEQIEADCRKACGLEPAVGATMDIGASSRGKSR